MCRAAQEAGAPHREYISQLFSPKIFKVAPFFHSLAVFCMCRAAQEAGAPHREYIDRKKENVIFILLYLGDRVSD